MYVDSGHCNQLIFNIGHENFIRNWNIKVTQLSCDDRNLAPKGCTKYFYGVQTGEIQSYNYDGQSHLANQREKFCIRREIGTCSICYNPAADGEFDLGQTVSKATWFTLRAINLDTLFTL